MGRNSRFFWWAVLVAGLAGQGGCASHRVVIDNNNNLELGLQAEHHGEYTKAIQYDERALANFRALDDRLGEASSLNNLGNVYNALGDYAKAREYHEQSLAISKGLRDQSGEGRSLSGLGNVYENLGDYAKAREYHEQSLAIAKALGDRVIESRSLANLGNISWYIGDFAQARRFLEQSLAIAKALGDRYFEGITLRNLGNVSGSIGNYTQAREYYEQSLEIAKSLGDQQGMGASFGNLGTVYLSLGDNAQALEYFAQSLAIAKALGDRKGMELALGNLGTVSRVLGDSVKAQQYYKQAATIGQTIVDVYGVADNLIKFCDILLEQSQSQEVLNIYNKLSQFGPLKDAIAMYSGFYHLRLGEFSQALEQFKKILVVTENSRLADSRFAVYMGMGQSYEGLKNWQGSLVYYQKAVDLIETQRDQLASGSRSQFLGKKLFIFNRIGAYEGLARVALANGDAATGLHWAEHTKARLFMEALARKEIGKGLSLPAELAQQEDAVKTQLASLYKQQDAAFNAKNTALFQSLETKLVLAKQEQDSFIAQLRREQPAYAAVAYPQPLHLQDIKLKPNEVLLEYEVTDTATLGWLVRDGNVVKTLYWPVSRKDLSERVQRFHDNLSNSDNLLTPPPFDAELSRSLYRDLVAPFAAELKPSDSVVIVPDDALAQMPFEALVDDGSVASTATESPLAPVAGDTRGSERINSPSADSSGGLHFLGDSYSLLYAQSATALVQTRQFRRTSPASGKPLLVVADPVFSLADARVSEKPTLLAQTDTSRARQVICEWGQQHSQQGCFERLPSTSPSALRLAAMFGGAGQVDILSGFQANEDEVKRRLQLGYRYGIFATHGILAKQIPYLQEPSLVLSLVSPGGTYLASESTGSPGFLTLAEVMSLKIDSDLLALTACNTGMGRDLLGEGAMSMGRGFQYAGVDSVLMSLWSVDDASTNVLTEKFFAHLREGKGKLASLRLARADVRQQHSHPFYWAPFILVGEQ